MKKTVIRFGLLSFVVTSILFLIMLVVGQGLSFNTQAVLGYATIVISLSFVFFGIKHYRDKENNGTISFGKALALGMLITLFVGLGFAVIDFIYTAYINPDFLEQYTTYSLTELEKTFSGEELIAAKEKLKSDMESMGSSSFMAFIMFVTVTLIGFIISLVSSLFLQHK